MDWIDQKILVIPAKDSAVTIERLGAPVGRSPSPAHRHVRALETSG